MSDLFKNSEHLKLNHHNYMSWRNLIRADLLAVNAYEIAIGNEQYPDDTTNAIRAQQHEFRKRVGKGLRAILSICADYAKFQLSYINDLNKPCKVLKAKCSTAVPFLNHTFDPRLNIDQSLNSNAMLTKATSPRTRPNRWQLHTQFRSGLRWPWGPRRS